MDSLEKILSGPIQVYTSPYLRDNFKMVICFTDSAGGSSSSHYGSLNLAYHVGDKKINVDSNRKLILQCLGLGRSRNIYSAKQVHGDSIIVVDEKLSGRSSGTIEADCLVTSMPSTPLMVMGADCNLILVADTSKRIVAAVHAGWKGTLAGILKKTISFLKEKYTARPRDLSIYFGPSIRKCCYRIDTDMLDKFTAKYGNWDFYYREAEEIFLDLVKLNKLQLKDSGVTEKKIFDCGKCTFCSPDFFSYRRNRITGRQAGIAAILQA